MDDVLDDLTETDNDSSNADVPERHPNHDNYIARRHLHTLPNLKEED